MEDNFDISGLKKKKKVNSRTKGSTFERQIAKKLNERFNTTEFMRSPGSGAFASTHTLPEHLKIHGDLITPKNFKFCIECKKGYNKENLYSLYNNSSDFWGFIKQSEKDSEKSKKLPLVIFKQDRQPILAVVPFNIEFPSIPKISIHYEDKKYNIYLFDDIISFDSSYWFC
jgi:Holliday junction resolvase